MSSPNNTVRAMPGIAGGWCVNPVPVNITLSLPGSVGCAEIRNSRGGCLVSQAELGLN
jgi:hypothetical protein